MNVLDLFSGIGGFSLGLERAGMRTLAFCEIDPFARAVLAQHWPEVFCFEDVRHVTKDILDTFGLGPVDLVCGGFPCQDISLAGKGAGLAGERSGLFFEIARLASEIRPRWLLLENVAALRSRGLDTVLRELAALGYDAQWHCVPASAVGAPHRRDRVWVVANAPEFGRGEERPDSSGRGAGSSEDGRPAGLVERGPVTADTAGLRLAFWEGFRRNLQCEFEAAQRGHRAHGWWGIEPPVGRVADGVPARVDRLRALGNAVVPQIPELIGRAILATEATPPG